MNKLPLRIFKNKYGGSFFFPYDFIFEPSNPTQNIIDEINQNGFIDADNSLDDDFIDDLVRYSNPFNKK